MATNLTTIGRCQVNRLQVGQTIRRLQWLKDKVIISGDEANDVVLSVYDWVELVKEEKEAV